MEWKNVIHNGVEYPEYQISDSGNFRSMDRIITHNKRTRNGNVIKVTRIEKGKEHAMTRRDADGYVMVRIIKYPDIKISVGVHRLVAMVFIPNPENKKEVNHKNGIITDNRVENLEWVTPTENMHHSHRSLKNRKLKVTKEQCEEIKLKWYNKTHSNKQLCNEYGISSAQVSRIVNNKRRQFGW